jgi:hypothetical protein
VASTFRQLYKKQEKEIQLEKERVIKAQQAKEKLEQMNKLLADRIV